MSQPSPAPEPGASEPASPGAEVPSASGGDAASPPPPGSGAPAGTIGGDAQAVLDAARAAARSYLGGFTTLRRLFAAEVSLARDALIHALVYLLVATVMLGTAYLLLTALLVSGLRAMGAPWPLALGAPLVLSVAVAWFGIQRAGTALKHADFEATRRQLKRGFKVDPDKETPL